MADGEDNEDGEKDKRHPKSSYNAKYPYNRVEVTESGHENHWDDTPGDTRIRQAHRSGTYYEISHKGRQTEMIVDNHHQYIKGGHTHTVDKNSDSRVKGSKRTNVGGHDHKEVKGDQTRAIGKDNKSTVGGDSTSSVKGDHVHGVVGDMHFKIGKNLEVKGDSELKSKIDAAAKMEFGDTLKIIAETQIILQCGQSLIIMDPGKITIASTEILVQASGKINTDSGGETYIHAGGDVVTLGATTKIQKGGMTIPRHTVP
jgi:hypothetical protein